MTEILSAVSLSVFSWSLLGHRSLPAFLLQWPEKGVWWHTPCRTHPVRVSAVAVKLTDLISISRNAATWRHLSSSLWYQSMMRDIKGLMRDIKVWYTHTPAHNVLKQGPLKALGLRKLSSNQQTGLCFHLFAMIETSTYLCSSLHKVSFILSAIF